MPLGTVDRVDVIGSIQFHLPVARANAGLLPGEVVFQPHHIDAGGLVDRRLVRLAEEGRIILSGPLSSAEAEGAACFHHNIYLDDGRFPSSGTTSSSSSPEELARMIGSSNLGSLPTHFIPHRRFVADGRLRGRYGAVAPTSTESSPGVGQTVVRGVDC